MKVFIKNMVCGRCKKAVSEIFTALGIEAEALELGEVTLKKALTAAQKKALSAALAAAEFELIEDKPARLIEQIKTLIIGWAHYSEGQPPHKYSELISTALHHDYSYLSRLFSGTEGITIGQYFILQKTERVKELMIYDELSLSQIAAGLGYSSVAHLSAQFKKVTGMTPTYFKSLRQKDRKMLDEVGKAK